MRRLTSIAAIFLMSLVLSACAGKAASRIIATESQGVRTDVFREVTGSERIPAGFADVIIEANIKTHQEGYYVLEPKDLHGKPGYPFVINIDGQAVIWNVDGVKDAKPLYIENGGRSLDPEAGEGMKYVLEKKIRLEAGPHKVFFGLPEESYYLTTGITVEDGRSYVLEFKPHYEHKAEPSRPTFLKGIRSYEVLLNKIDTR